MRIELNNMKLLTKFLTHFGAFRFGLLPLEIVRSFQYLCLLPKKLTTPKTTGKPKRLTSPKRTENPKELTTPKTTGNPKKMTTPKTKIALARGKNR